MAKNNNGAILDNGTDNVTRISAGSAPVTRKARIYSPDRTLADLFDMAGADKLSKGSASRSLKSEVRTGTVTVEGLFADDKLETIAQTVLESEETRKATLKSKPTKGHENQIASRSVTVGSNETTAKILTHTVYVD